MSLSKKTTKAKKLEVKPSVLQWCRDQVEQGKELVIHWEGGGDSGWCYFKINGKEVNNEYTEYLVDMMYAELDYGSWAGEFSAVGDATFSLEENAFVGEDSYSEEDLMHFPCVIPFEVSESLWFDSISIDTEADDADDEIRVECIFNIRNGFKSSDHLKEEENISKVIKTQLIDFITEMCNSGVEYSGVSRASTFEIKDAIKVDNKLRFTLKDMDVRVRTTDDKYISLEIGEDEMLPELTD